MKKYFVILLLLISNSAFGMGIIRSVCGAGKQLIGGTLGSIRQFPQTVRSWSTRKKIGAVGAASIAGAGTYFVGYPLMQDIKEMRKRLAKYDKDRAQYFLKEANLDEEEEFKRNRRRPNNPAYLKEKQALQKRAERIL